MSKLKHSVLYFNAYYNDDNIFIEAEGLPNVEDAIEEAGEFSHFPYAFTLEVDLFGDTKRLDLESRILDYKYREPDYERLTGHEMGVAMGRV